MSIRIDAVLMCKNLAHQISDEYDRGADLSKQVISVSCPDFKILFVPTGSEQVAKMELNG